MRRRHIDEPRARSGIAAGGDRRVSRRDPLDRHRLDLVLVGVEIRKAEDAEAGRVLVELRDDEVIILALFDIIGRAAQRRADRLMLVLIARLQRLHLRIRSEEHTSELQSLMRSSYAGFCLKNKTTIRTQPN